VCALCACVRVCACVCVCVLVLVLYPKRMQGLHSILVLLLYWMVGVDHLTCSIQLVFKHLIGVGGAGANQFKCDTSLPHCRSWSQPLLDPTIIRNLPGTMSRNIRQEPEQNKEEEEPEQEEEGDWMDSQEEAAAEEWFVQGWTEAMESKGSEKPSVRGPNLPPKDPNEPEQEEEEEELGCDKWARLRGSEGPAQGPNIPPASRKDPMAPYLQYSHSCYVCRNEFRCVPKVPPVVGFQPLDPAIHGCRCLNHYYNYFLCSNKCFWLNNGSHPY
jgi:hypothetical protein